ncbi:MAG: hypothetical protein NUV86_08055 [Candidatus Scalindua sp.]|nr:hypothetical protein [Candidatus Scalindua sp.]MCR4345487.1 hypothetical protein [Candidatus Scalindua sp.]
MHRWKVRLYILTKEKEETDVSKRVKGISDAKRKYKICSLSGTFDSHLLWSHYAGGFDGVAICLMNPVILSKLKMLIDKI